VPKTTNWRTLGASETELALLAKGNETKPDAGAAQAASPAAV